MDRFGVLRKATRCAALGLWALTGTGMAWAQSHQVAGEYVCTEARVAGKTVPCMAAQSEERWEI
jgi:hypothetical protein